MALDVTLLLGAVLAYGVATLLLAQGSTVGVRAALRHPAWLAGLALQAVGFVLAFLARRDLPLLVVQPATTASVAVTCVLGLLVGRWALSRRDVLALGVVVAAVTGLGLCAVTGPAQLPGPLPLAVLAAVLVLVCVEAWRSVRKHAPTTGAALWVASAAGVAFGVGAVGARALAGDPLARLSTVSGLLAFCLIGVGTVVGQLLLTAAMSGGAVGGPTATMHVVETIGPALFGLTWLGDAVLPGRLPLAVACTALALAGSLALAGHGSVPAAVAEPAGRD